MDAENRSNQQRNFDDWLASALCTRTAEPRRGLEERVLARLAFEPQPKIRWWPAMAMASAVIVTAVAIALLLRPTQPERVANRTTKPASASRVASAVMQPRSVPSTASVHKNRNSLLIDRKNSTCCGSTRVVAGAHPEQHLPKLASFPTAHPETDQEGMLAQLAAQLSAQRQFSDIANVSLDAPAKDLSITELRIDPLEGTPMDSNPH